MLWLAILWESLCSITALCDRKTAKESEAISKNPRHPMVQILFPHNVPIFQNYYSPDKLLNKFKCGLNRSKNYSVFMDWTEMFNNTDLEGTAERTRGFPFLSLTQLLINNIPGLLWFKRQWLSLLTLRGDAVISLPYEYHVKSDHMWWFKRYVK